MTATRITGTPSIIAICIAASFLFIPQNALADGESPAPQVVARYSSGHTEISTLKEGAECYTNRKTALTGITPELNGLMFAQRAAGLKSPTVTISVPARATIYLLIDSDTGDNAADKGVAELHHTLSKSGWARLADVGSKRKGLALAVYKQSFTKSEDLTIPEAGFSGVIVASKQLAIAGGKESHADPSDQNPEVGHAGPRHDSAPMAGPATRIARRQTSIKALYVNLTDTRLMLGHSADFILTLTPGVTARLTSVTFASPVGDQTYQAVDDVLRSIHLQYPNWYVDNAEFTLSEKFTSSDESSIGAAVGTLILSSIEGFEIDPAVAMTGKVSPDGKIHSVIGVAAKLRGAAGAHCSLVALPDENFDQLVDAMVYDGSPAENGLQVIGISSLQDAVAFARTNRDAPLSQAMSLFQELQKAIHDSPKDIHSAATQEVLAKILELCPAHLSAKWMLLLAQDKQPRTLSAKASFYYTMLAAQGTLPALLRDSKNPARLTINSTVVRDGLAALDKLRPIADPKAHPLIDAWSRYFRLWIQVQSGQAPQKNLQLQIQAVLDAMSSVKMDQDLMQKMAQEGI